MQHALVEFEMVPAEPERLGKPEAVRKEHEEEGCAAKPPASFASCFKDPLDFFGSEVLAFARPAGSAGLTNFSLYASWGRFWHGREGKYLPNS